MNFFVAVDKAQQKKEREKARVLRKSPWWKQQLAKGVCYYCEQSFSSDELTMDHKVPLARGGRSTKSNIVTACKSCNTDKKYQTPVEMLISNSKK